MAKIKNVSGQDLIVPGLGGRLVIAGAVVEVDDDDAPAYTCQPTTWKDATPKDEPSKAPEPPKEG